MAKSFLIAVLTFVVLGLHYRNKSVDSPAQQADGVVVEDARQAARSAALAGLNIAKERLIESWRSKLFAGRCKGAKYNAAATVRDERARIESIGRAFNAANASETYRLRVDMYRSRRDGAGEGEASDFSFRFRPAALQ